MQRARKHESCLKSALFTNNVPEAVYENLTEAVKKRSLLPDISKPREKALGLDSQICTIFTFLLCLKFPLTCLMKKLWKPALRRLSLLEKEYCAVLGKGLLQGWVDRYENRGKQTWEPIHQAAMKPHHIY